MSTTPTQQLFAEADFRKASRSEAKTECVQVARRENAAQLRDSKTGFDAADDGRLTVSSEQFAAFARALRS